MVIYLDSGYLSHISTLISRVSGVTTNPSILKAAVVKDYKGFAKEVLPLVEGKPVSFEVFSDDMEGMEAQAREISSWGENVYVKIPVTNTKGDSTDGLVRKLGMDGIKLNVTAVFTFQQIDLMARSLIYAPSILSIFAGRISDTGRDPVPFIQKAVRVKSPQTQVLWASTRQVMDTLTARSAGADIITLSPDLIRKLSLIGKDLTQYSLETVQQFYKDAQGLVL